MSEKLEELLNKVSADEIKELIAKLPKKVRNMLPKSEIEILDRMNLLPENISTGRILNIIIEDSFEGEGGIQTALLYALDDEVSTKLHSHNDKMETIVAIRGHIKMDGVEMSANICKLGGEHKIDNMRKGDIIGTFKVRPDKIGEYFKQNKTKGTER